MQSRYFPKSFFSLHDLLVLLFIGSVIYAVIALGQQWQTDFRPATVIDLSISALPQYTILSAGRGILSYFISLVFTLVVGYAAAKSKVAEKIIIPLLDIGQSIPALGFMPGLVLGLIALFPHSNIGLELTAIIMIFTSQVWNMAFSFYSSLKSVPPDFRAVSDMMGLGWYQRLKRIELPYGAVDLAWNSVVSMAGGWFFLGVCEAFTMGERQYRLPGIGSYMAVAINEGDKKAMVAAVIAMVLLIVVLDFFIWRPILSWVRRFRVEEGSLIAAEGTEPLMQVVIRESRIVRFLRALYHRTILRRLQALRVEQRVIQLAGAMEAGGRAQVARVWAPSGPRTVVSKILGVLLKVAALGAVLYLIIAGALKLLHVLSQVSWSTWVVLLRDTFWTLLRVTFSLVLGTLWTVPVGIWLGTSFQRIRVAQPIIQILASFPAPMLYPLVLAVFFKLGINFDYSSMFLMMLGAQWYILFNVLAGTLRIPQELRDALSLMKASRWTRWKRLYLPSIFPQLITGWVIAAGGAWNASIVAEYLSYQGSILRTGGLGSTITAAAAAGNFPVLAASLTLMVAVVLLLNRALWGPIYQIAQTRFRLDV